MESEGDTQPLDDSGPISEDQADPEDLEDGELEDGEIDEEEPSGSVTQPSNVEAESVPLNKPAEKKGEGDSSDSGESNEDEKQKEKKRKRKKEKRKRDKKEKEKHDKKKKKKKKFVDYDNVKDDEKPSGDMWNQSKYDREAPGPYDSPYDSPEEENVTLGGYRKNSYKGSSSPYNEPPGLYDSPSDGEGDYGPPPTKMTRYDRGGKKTSLMSMLDDGYMDATVAANEKQDMFDKMSRGPQNKKKIENKRLYYERVRQRQNANKDQQENRERERPVCKFYKDGKCQKGDDCQYSHESGEVYKKKEICKFYLNSFCSKGNNCLFMHGEYPCKFFHTGKECFQGDNCKFSHAEITDETRPLLERLKSQEEEKVERYEQEFSSSPRKKPSLLGSPPRNSMGKKIPSLFDIQVFPPGQRPPNMNNGPGGQGQGPGPVFGPRPGMPSPMNNPLGPGLLHPGMRPMGPMGPGLLRPPGNMSPSNQRPPAFYGGNRYSDEEDSSQREQKKPEEGSPKESEDKENENGENLQDKDGNSEEKKGNLDNIDIPAALAPKQRELFLRIHQQQRDHNDSGKATPTAPDDEKWYSSDEEDSSNTSSNPPNNSNVTDMLQAIRNQPPPGLPNHPPLTMPPPNMMRGPPPPMMMRGPPPPFNQMPPQPRMDITSMLTALRNVRGSTSSVQVTMNTNRDPRASGVSSDPRNAQSDPRSGGRPQPDVRLQPADPVQSLLSMANIKTEPKSFPEPTVIYSQEGSVEWKLRDVTLEKRSITTLPTNIHPMDPRLPKLQKEVIKCSKHVKKEESKPKIDPRLLRQNSRVGESPQHSDPRSSSDPRTSVKANDPRSGDPRTTKAASGTSPEHSEDIKPNVSQLDENMPSGLKLPPPPERQFSNPMTAFRELAALVDPKNASRQNSMPELATVKRDPRMNSRSNSSDSDSGGNKLSYRNDPRFKKKPKSVSGYASNQTETEVSVKEEPEDKPSVTDTKVDSLRTRRGNLEHSSPLGGQEVEPNKSSENSYSAYNNRPKDTKPLRTATRTFSSDGKLSPSVPSDDNTGFVPPPLLVPELPVSHGILPAALEEQPPPLKDVFSTMDPTASPFC